MAAADITNALETNLDSKFKDIIKIFMSAIVKLTKCTKDINGNNSGTSNNNAGRW